VNIKNYKITLPNHSTIEAIPIDPKGEAGGNDDLVIYSEIWGWNNKAAKQMWTETTLSPLKFGKSLRWCETYAGVSGESEILEGLYDRGVTNGECIDAENEFYRNQRLLVIWNTKPTTPWQTQEYYAQEAGDLLENEFNRVHKNQWGSSMSSFVPAEWYDACRVPALPAYEKLEPWVVALDAAISGDCFGLVAVTRRGGITLLRHVRKWTPPKGGQIQFFAPKGTPPDEDETPAGELRRLAARHSIVKVCYDPFQLHSFCSQMREELIVFFEEFNQTNKRLVADKAFRDAIRERSFQHDGNLDLREHVLNANAQADTDTNKLRIVKRNDALKIDLAVCASMSSYEAEKMGLG
jgi:phage terminase large subunit-like protein